MADTKTYIRWNKYTPRGLMRVTEQPSYSLVKKTVTDNRESSTDLIVVAATSNSMEYGFRIFKGSERFSSKQKFRSLREALAAAKEWYSKNKTFWDGTTE